MEREPLASRRDEAALSATGTGFTSQPLVMHTVCRSGPIIANDRMAVEQSMKHPRSSRKTVPALKAAGGNVAIPGSDQNGTNAGFARNPEVRSRRSEVSPDHGPLADLRPLSSDLFVVRAQVVASDFLLFFAAVRD